MRLNEMFCDGMIFQANKPVRIFGTGGGMLEIHLCGQSYAGEVYGPDWIIALAPCPYGGPYEMTVVTDGRTRVIKDIYFGDVYVLAGQSNMQFKLRDASVNEQVCEDDPLLRLFSTERVHAGESFFPQDGWVKAEKAGVRDWSCLGYLAGKDLRKKADRAIGLITCYQGAADIQAFLPESAFENPAFVLEDKDRFDMMYRWNKGHSMLYNFQVKKIAPFSVAAIWWYQGESNASDKESAIYGDMLSCLIDSWRVTFDDSALPFVVVQIADFDGRNNDYWHRIQQFQAEIPRKRPSVKTVISRDVCETNDIHPKSKQALALRIAEATTAFETEKA